VLAVARLSRRRHPCYTARAISGAIMKRLIGQKVWVIQFDDEDTSVIGIVDAIDQGFVALRNEREQAPSLYVNLQNVKEIELYRTEGEGELRLLRFPEDRSN
jgi:hypothetical protein